MKSVDVTSNPLDEFLAAAILTTGQDYAPLLPPITHDGLAVQRTEISPDSTRLLTFGTDGTVRLWDMRAAKPIAILWRGNERVVNGGFSSDSKTVFTDDETGVARFWEPTDGKLRAQTGRRPNNYAEVFVRESVAIPNGMRTAFRIGRAACAVIGRDRLREYLVANGVHVLDETDQIAS